ncbi:unnamed protein product [Lepidochelys kempii]
MYMCSGGVLVTQGDTDRHSPCVPKDRGYFHLPAKMGRKICCCPQDSPCLPDAWSPSPQHQLVCRRRTCPFHKHWLQRLRQKKERRREGNKKEGERNKTNPSP